jgi:UDP-3-O-[3-hydroxymyristoyl] N-acetylglucosamine deacetylase
LPEQVTVEGRALHSGERARVVVRRRAGPFRLVQRGMEAELQELSVASTERATTVEARGGAMRVGTVEHAFAALAGLGLHGGVTLEVDGPELPLLDGGASEWCGAFAALEVPRSSPSLHVARHVVLEKGRSRYELTPSARGFCVEVHFETNDPRLARRARWDGDPDDFVARIAPARTFALAAEVVDLERRGLARHVDPRSVVVIAPDAIHYAGRPFEADEPARHKLLDLVGDLFLHGGPPFGHVLAVRPGHESNILALRAAIADGVLVPR